MLAVVAAAMMSFTLTTQRADATTPPSVSSVRPSLGPTSGGTTVTVTGSGFLSATAVTFGGVPATFLTIYNDNQMTVRAPAHFAGTVDVVVFAGVFQSLTTPNDWFTYQFLFGFGIAVTGISPSSGPSTGGTLVTVIGSGFTSATAVTFDGVTAFPNVFSDNYLTVISPSHAPGAADVRVWGPGGIFSSFSGAATFLYTGGPVVAFAVPASGPSSGGTRVTLTGTGLLGTVAVTFGGASGTNLIVLSGSQVMVTTPPHAVGTVDVVVWSNITGSGATGAGLFTYVGGSTVSGVSPNTGPAAGGALVTVRGSGFSGASAVSFGGTLGTNMTVTNDSQLVVTSPAHSAGTVDVTVIVGGGSSATNSNDQFTFVETPPVSPPARFAGSVTVNGQSAGPGTAVEARVGGATCGTATAFISSGQARYVVDVFSADAAHPGCGSDGTSVSFFVGGVQAGQTGTWHNYQLNTLDLTVGAAPTAVPTARPTLAPLPPNAGSGPSLSEIVDARLALVMMGAMTLLGGAALRSRRGRA